MISSLEKNDIVAAISNYKKLKKGGEPEKEATNKPNKCYFCGYDCHPKQKCLPKQECNKCKGKKTFCPIILFSKHEGERYFKCGNRYN